MTHAKRAEELAHWIRLEQTPGVGPETARKLLSAFGLPEKVFAAGFAALRQVVSERVTAALTAPESAEMRAQIDKTIAWAEQPGNFVLTLADAGYPQALLDIADPPSILYAKGRVELLSSPSLAVVGSRNATAQGIVNAEKFSEVLSHAGLTIISGMALGIDTAAHEGSLRGMGSTVAVIGTGADIVYPARNRGLAHRIAAEGCIISEYPLGMPAIAANFPRRNRIISGLARGVLVIEAAAQSGSLITARMAGEQGRDVFAIPGSIHSPLSKGCHQLIKQGAKLVESAQDILEELGEYETPAHAAAMNEAGTAIALDDPLLRAMGFDPVDIDTLAARCALDAASINAQLLTLELEGSVENLPGGMYRRLV
ncbi:DNA-protecting protein DprA [Noviherbaspirillum cavernae]|uniref:DNA-protecting protein DprA n=1 Tax=Noviherbaspirillum cavernae TaxID=2320862 RepID=A0A418WX29_9BURK|nr:DNA-processing protein DprA [Noviherbaspirillum cavernae]RJG04790.1 DNA-protecting protein DprA [Noviherbaspirillum cavernae]